MSRIAYGIVRDKDGNVKVDDPSTLHPIQVMMLTAAERQKFGLWEGAYIQDAQGFKRATRLSDGVYRAEEGLVAASVIHDEGQEFKLKSRVDLASGGALTVRKET